MNGRLYDPQLRRFLAPDNYIQNPYNTQNFNRYSYVLNNPLMYVDPSGEMAEENSWLFRAIGAVIASVASSVNWKSVGNWASNNFKSAVNDVSNFVRDIGRSIKKFLGGGSKKVPIKTIENPTIVNSDPLASTVSNIPSSFFGGGGTSTGGLGVSLSNVKTWVGKQFTRFNEFDKGLKDGFIAGLDSTGDFIKSLGTKQGWKDLGQGFVNLSHMANQYSSRGMVLRNQMASSIDNYITNIPSMSAYEVGYDLGFASEKAVESIVLTKGAGFGVNVAKIGFGQAMFKSSTFGYKSLLFGRRHHIYLPDGVKGILNRGPLRTGWGNFSGRDVFRTSIGNPPGNKHIDWFFRN